MHNVRLHNPHLLPKVRSDLLKGAMRSYPCTLRISSLIPGYTCAGQDTVVGCHLPGPGKGVGTKVSDLHIAAGCLRCHDILDRRDSRWEYLIERCPSAFYERLLHGLCETQSLLVRDGLILIPDMEVTK